MRCDACQRTKRSKNKYSKFPTKLVEETPWNKLCVYLIGPFKIRRIGKETLILKDVTTIDPITGWFEITQYNGKKAMTIMKLVETTRKFSYPWPV